MKKSFPRVHGKSREEVQELETKKSKYLSYCAKMGWSERQCMIIGDAIQSGVSVLDIETYVDISYTADQMFFVFKGISDGFTCEQIAVYNNTDFNPLQMREIYECFKNKNDIILTIEDVSKYASPIFSNSQMNFIFTMLKHNVGKEFVEAIAHPEISYESMWNLYHKFTGKNIEMIKELAALKILEG